MSNLNAMREFEFVSFDGAGENEERSTLEFAEKSQARAKAGSMAKKRGGPVDLAFAGAEEWNERYIVTAIPSEFTASGFMFERLDS